MTYNITCLDNATIFIGHLSCANDASNGMLGLGIIIALYAIVFISLITKFGFSKAFAYSSFLTTIPCILLASAGILPADYIYTFAVMLIFGIILLVYDLRK